MHLDENKIAESVINAIQRAVGKPNIALHEPWLRGNEARYINNCLESNYVSSVGKYVDEFEYRLSEYTGARYVIAVINGTAALHTALIISGVQPGDEVIIPTLTFIATANAVSYCGATPHFVDSEASYAGISVPALRDHLKSIAEITQGNCINAKTGKIIRAIIPMHIFGHPVDLDGIMSVASDYKLAVIEDAAESLGSLYNSKHTGTFGIVGALSFNGNKTITTGGGGAILTNDEYLASRAKHITTTAKMPHRWEIEHTEVAYNYRLPNINAALGCAQLEQIDKIIENKRKLYAIYSEEFKNIKGISILNEPPNCRSNYWLQTLRLDRPCSVIRDAILEATNNAGYMTRPLWRPLHKLHFYSSCPRANLPIAEDMEMCLVNLPSSAFLVE